MCCSAQPGLQKNRVFPELQINRGLAGQSSGARPHGVWKGRREQTRQSGPGSGAVTPAPEQRDKAGSPRGCGAVGRNEAIGRSTSTHSPVERGQRQMKSSCRTDEPDRGKQERKEMENLTFLLFRHFLEACPQGTHTAGVVGWGRGARGRGGRYRNAVHLWV